MSRLPEVKLEYERRTGRRLTYQEIQDRAGIAATTISRLMSRTAPVERIAGHTLSGLCRLLNCRVGDLLVYVPDEGAQGAQEGETNVSDEGTEAA